MNDFSLISCFTIGILLYIEYIQIVICSTAALVVIRVKSALVCACFSSSALAHVAYVFTLACSEQTVEIV